MPPRRASRGPSSVHIVPSPDPEFDPSDPMQNESMGDNQGGNQNESYEPEYEPGYEPYQNAEPMEMEEDDTASSNRGQISNHDQRSNRDQTQPDPIDRMCERMMDRLERYGSSRRQPQSPPSFLTIVSTMRSLGTERFAGGTDPMAADAWLKNLEKNFGATRCPDEYKKDVAVYYLERDAADWWDYMERSIGQYYTQQVAWSHFRLEFLRRYFPVEARDRMEMRYMELRQGSMSVREYEAEFTRLRRYVRVGSEDEEAVMRKFLRGLRPDLYSRLQVIQPMDLASLVETAVNVEDAIEREAEYAYVQKRKKEQQDQKDKGKRQKEGTSGKKSGRPPPTCYKCGKVGHRQNQCTAQVATRPDVTCWSCGEVGHFANKCPKYQKEAPPQPRPGTQRKPLTDELRAKDKQPAGRVYALDTEQPGSSRARQTPIAGTQGF